MGLGDIKAFNDLSTYIGTSLETDNAPIIQFFTDKYPTGIADTSPVYISSSKTLTGTSLNEGKRPLYVYADEASGIFVGKNADKNPSDSAKMSKIKLESSTSSQKITLSALNANDKKSNLILHATGTGSLYHTGNWNTNIGGSLTVTSGTMIRTINGNFNNTVTSNFNNTVKDDFNNTVSGDFNNIVSGSFKLETKNRENKRINAITVTSTATKISNINNIALLSGSIADVNNNYGTQINAVNTITGIALRTCRSNAISSLPDFAIDKTGSAGLFLQPDLNDDTSIPHFRLTVGGKKKNNVIFGNSSIYNSIDTNTNKGVIIITPNLNIEDGNAKGILNAGTINAKKYSDPSGEIGGNIVADKNITASQGNIIASRGNIIAQNSYVQGTRLYAGGRSPGQNESTEWHDGFIHGDGRWIKNTADGGSVYPSGGGSVSVGGSVTINIPNITFNQGRPYFGNTTPISIAIKQLDENTWATHNWVQTWVNSQNYVTKRSSWRNIDRYNASDSYDKTSIENIINILITSVNLLGITLSQ